MSGQTGDGKDGDKGATFPYDYPSTSTSYVSTYSGKAPYFNGTDYAAWKHKMKMHLKSINPSIWRIVEKGYVLQKPEDPTKEDDENEHKNAQAANVILSALSGSEFNRVDDIESAKVIWDTLRNLHEGTDSVRESKVEILKGQFERFVMLDGESPSDMYDHLSKIVNEIKGLGSKDMTDEVVVKKMVRAITLRNSTLVTIIRERPDYKTLTPHDLLGRILAHDMLVQESKEVIQYINQSSTTSIKKEDLALKAKEEEEESRKSKSKEEIDDEEMTLFVKKFGKFMRRSGFFKGSSSKHHSNKLSGRHSARVCYVCKEPGHFIADCPYLKDGSHIKEDKMGEKKDEKKEKHKHSKRERYGQAHLGKIFGSDSESSSSDEEGIATFAVKPSSPPRLFNYSSDEDAPICLMAKEPKVPSSLKSFNVDLVSDEEDDVEDEVMDEELFKSITKESLPHLSELLGRIEDQYATLERQEALLIREKERSHELKGELAKEREKNEALVRLYKQTKESHANLEVTNAQLQERVDGLDKAYLSLEEKFETLKNSVSLPSEASCSKIVPSNEPCARCKDIDIDACATNSTSLSALQKQNEKLMGLLHNGLLKCHMGSKALKEYLGYQRDHFNHEGLGYVPPPKGKVDKSVLIKKPQGLSNFVKAKSILPNGHASHCFFDASYVLRKNASGRVVAKYVGPRGKNVSIKRVLWVPKALVTNMRGPKQEYHSGGRSWVIDSGCTNHMTGEESMFSSLDPNGSSQENIVFGDDGKGKVMGLGKITISNDLSISNVLLSLRVFSRTSFYLVDFSSTKAKHKTCLVAKSDMGWLWHRRLAYVGMRNLHKLLKHDHILGLTNVQFEKDRMCSACQAGKQIGAHHPVKNVMTTTRPLELLHMDLFGPIAYLSIGGNKYGLVIVDDFSRFTWVFFLHDKSETQAIFKKFERRAQNEFDLKIKNIRSDNGKEFKNTCIESFLDEEGIKHEFSAPYSPQQNGVAERKNWTLIEMARTMLDEYKTSDRFWAEAVNTACHAINCLYLHRLLKKTAYELLTGEEEDPSEAIKRLALGDVRPREPQQGASSSTQVEPRISTQADNPSTSSLDQGEEGEQVPPAPINLAHPRIHQSIQRDHPTNSILGDINKGVSTRSRIVNFCEHYSFVSSLEPLRVKEALNDPDWVMAMQEELNNFTWNEVWTLVERSRQNVIGTKWIFRNKQDEAGVVIRNKARMYFRVVLGRDKIGKADSTLFTKRHNNDIFVCQIYVDDIVFGSTNKSFSEEFSRMMTKRFEMSMMGELKFFLGLQIKQLKERTFICQTKYLKDMLKKFGMENAKPIHTPMPSNGHLDLNEQGKDVDQKGARFDLIGYADADYAGCKVDRKSTSGTCQFLGRSLVFWSSKKQNSVALSTAEAEYVSAGSCAQLLWMKQTLRDYGLNVSKIPLLCDNESAIKIANNLVQHSRTKHIDIRHHFLRDHSTSGDIDIQHCILMIKGQFKNQVYSRRGSMSSRGRSPSSKARHAIRRMSESRKDAIDAQAQASEQAAQVANVERGAPLTPRRSRVNGEGSSAPASKVRRGNPTGSSEQGQVYEELHDPIIDEVIEACAWQNLKELMGLQYPWCKEIIAQFYATVYFEPIKEKTIHWMTDGIIYSVTYAKFAAILGFPARSRTNHVKIHDEKPMDTNSLHFLYQDVDYELGTIKGLRPFYAYLNKLLHKTLYPKEGDASNVLAYTRNLLYKMKAHPQLFDAFDFIFEEIRLISMMPKRGLGYGPYIMKMIEIVSKRKFHKEVAHTGYQVRPIKAAAVPAGRTTRASSHAGPSTTVTTSDSNSSLRFFKSIFNLCKTISVWQAKERRARKKDTRRIKNLLHNANLPCSPDGSEVEDSGEDVIEDPFAAEASSSRADRGKAPLEEEEEEEGDYAEESSEEDEDSDEDE
uniref:Retrotransposon protein, putative, Ty1-copia subclass n=1 Tax=Oryza sativa subsp. japonica TaxID=39947 RepID=Q10IC4_ORYSJ|nr:retrotransposon protein, putative, Ty1-copia subclass [Oryza sativa Japonica Group]